MSVDQWSSIPKRPRGRNATLAVIAKLLSNTTTKFDLIIDTRMLLECAPGPGHPLRELQRTKTELEAWRRSTRSESLICTQWQRAWMLKAAANYPDAALVPELKRIQPVGGRVTFVAKQEFSGFVRSTLDSVLRANGIDEVYITGINTQICVFRTAIDAWERGYLVRVVDDGCTSNQGGHWGHKTGISMLRKYWHYPDGTWAIVNSSDISPTPVRGQPNPFAETFARPAATRDHLELSTGSTP